MRTSITSLLALAATARAGVLKRDLTIQTLDNWSSLGCWSDSTGNRTLSYVAELSQWVSGSECQWKCQNAGYIYAGTEYGGQCYCDNTLGTASVQEPDPDCNMPCPADNTQPCGGPNRLNLYWNVTQPTPTSSTPPAIETAVDGYTEMGCYTDEIGNRGLANRVSTAGGYKVMTVQTCVDACAAANYSLAGVEYSSECYCANAITGNQTLASDQGSCNMACRGDASSLCGGAGRMNLYSLGGATPAIAAPPTTPSPVNPTLPAGWAAIGCYSDSPSSRALSNFYSDPPAGMTVEYCTSKCAAEGYTIAGVEYGGECWCDNVIHNQQGLASDGNAGCNMPCHGNAGETCGGGNRLSVYATGSRWMQIGCFTDQVYHRTLANLVADNSTLTTESCLAACQAAGYPLCSTSYASQCFGGYTIDNGNGISPDGPAGCNFACSGNASEICGGNSHLTMYEFLKVDGSVGSSS